MARMIPAFVEENTPSGERAVYSLLAGGPDDWMAIHSLDIAPWNNGRRTELDFLVFIPDQGILCIEVKSHTEIRFDGERWFPESIKRSPFKQAADARFAFVRRMSDLDPQVMRVPAIHMCIFPNASFRLSANLSVAPWELMAGTEFRSFSSAEDFCSALKARMIHARGVERCPGLAVPLTPTRIESMIERCLPVQKRRPSHVDQARRRQEELESLLLDQQKAVLALASMNERLLVEGAAGTGKTLIAMEVAMRAAEQGHRVALLCHNRLIANWMEAQLRARSAPPTLVVDTASRMLARLADIAIPAEATSNFWESLPLQAAEKLTDPGFAAVAMFEYLVVDEAQDLLARQTLWDSVLHFLEGGVERGRYAFFGDFACQVLTSKVPLENAVALLKEHGAPVNWRLGENCRNLRPVAIAALRLSGFPTQAYDGYRRTGGAITDINFRPCGDTTSQLDALRGVLREAPGLGYKPADITVLSFCGPDASIAHQLSKQGVRLEPAGSPSSHATFTSVTAFKGLENRVIVVTDVNLSNGDLSRALFYTALTRSTGLVYVICSMADSSKLLRWAGATHT